MGMRFRWISILLVCGSLLLSRPAAAAASVAILPELELLSGVLLHSDWGRDASHLPAGKGSFYYRELKAYLAPYREHEAVEIANDLLKRGFEEDAMPGFITHLGPLPDLTPRAPYREDLLQRAGDPELLERFRLALIDLAATARFGEFVAKWQPRYHQWEAAFDLDAPRVVEWLESFFGGGGKGEYQILLAPALFRGGGYGSTVMLPDGTAARYHILRDTGRSNEEPDLRSAIHPMTLAAHEWGHSWVNPALEAHEQTVLGLGHLMKPVARAMRGQGYDHVRIFMNEQALRAVQVLFVEEMQGAAAAEAEIKYHVDRGFYMTPAAVEALREYQRQRGQYPVFQTFVPVLLERLKDVQVPPNYHPIGNYPTWPYLVTLGGLLAAGIGYWRVRAARRYRSRGEGSFSRK